MYKDSGSCSPSKARVLYNLWFFVLHCHVGLILYNIMLEKRSSLFISLFHPHILVSLHVRTTLIYYPTLSWMLLPLSLSLCFIYSSFCPRLYNLAIPNILISATFNFFFCAFFGHCWSYYSLVFPIDPPVDSLITQTLFQLFIPTVVYGLSPHPSLFLVTSSINFSSCRLISEFPPPLNLRHKAFVLLIVSRLSPKALLLSSSFFSTTLV